MKKSKQSQREIRILAVLKGNPMGMSLEMIANKIGVSRTTIAKDMHGLINSGKVVLREIGTVKLHYHISDVEKFKKG